MRENKKTPKLISFIRDKYFLLPALSALLLGLSRYPVKLNFLVFFAFIPLLYLMNRSELAKQTIGNRKPITRAKFIKTALTFSTVYTLVTLYWISVVTLPGFMGLFILFGAYFIILLYLVFKISTVLPGFKYPGFISCWLSFEWLQNFGELRFPWFNIGYSLSEYTSLIQVAELGGVYLLSLLILTINILLFVFLTNFPRKKSLVPLLVTALIIVLWSSWGSNRKNNLPLQEENFRAAIVQVSIPQYIKWDDDFYNTTLALYEEYTLKAASGDPDLIIWPESAIPDYIIRIKRPRKFVLGLIDRIETDLFLGFPHYETESRNDLLEYRFYNSTTLITAEGYIHRPYKKIYLVPFGERIPFMDYFPFLRNLQFGQANWEYGEEIIHYQIQKGDKQFLFSSLICFEIAFPVLTNTIAADNVDFMVNVTNDAWFKKTVGPYQHAMMTKIRAVETRTQIYRAANTGISLIVDPRGIITNRTKLYEKTNIEEKLYRYPGQTFYVKYLTYYPFIFLIITFLLIIALIIQGFSLKRL